MKCVVNVSDINQLAPMTLAAARLVTMAGNPEVNISEIVRIVEYDGALTANLLRWANSSWSGNQIPIASVKEAVMRLGMDMLLKLSVGSCLTAPMQKKMPEYALAEQELWNHGVASALTIECLQQKHALPINPIAFTAALIHDIGKLLLARHLSAEKIQQIHHLIKTDQVTYYEAEDIILGTNHARVGGDIGRFWKFPDPLVYAIEHHHDTSDKADPLLDAIQVANAVSKIIGVGLGSEQMNMKTSAQVLRRMGLTYAGLETVCVSVKDRLAEEQAKWTATPS